MHRAHFRFAAVFGVLIFAGRSDAQTATSKPMVLVGVKSSKHFITKAKDLTKTVMEAAGQDAMWPLIEGGLAQAVGAGGEKLPGLDTTKPIGFRIMYKAPTGPIPIDGDVLLAVPTTDASKFLQQGLPMLRLNPMPGEGGVTNFPIAGNLGGMAREKDGYVFITVADAGVIAAERLPKPSDVTGAGKYDLTFQMNLSAIPEADLRKMFTTLAQMNPQGRPPSDKDLQQIVDLDSMEMGLNLEPSSGKIVMESLQSAKSSSALSKMMKASSSGPLKSSIGLAPNAVFTMGMRGEWLAQSDALKQAAEGIKTLPGVEIDAPMKAILALMEELAKAEIEDACMSIAADGTTLIAASVGRIAAFELKIGEVVDAVSAEVAKDAGDDAAKVKERSKKKAVTLSGVDLARIWIPIPKKKPAEAANIYLGVKDKTAFLAVALSDSTKAIEEALKRTPIDDHDALLVTVKLKDLADAFEVDYKGSAAVKMESKGGDPMKTTMEIPAKDIAELYKAGLFDKLKERFKAGD